MINLILGQPGGGKSYEAVAFHILPALESGRKVITNMPLLLDALCCIDGNYRNLIVLRHSDIEVEKQFFKWNLFHRCFDKHNVKETKRPFADIVDYADSWRHPETGSGPLYVIDECHKCLPRSKTDLKVEEWFAEHRHEFADVLLITQSVGKISTSIRDLVQVVYRVKKATAFGANNSYIRKVIDGYRGEVVNESVRTYNPKFFRFYKSHTRSDSAGKELAASDIKPIWFRWPFIGAAVCSLLVVALLLGGAPINPMKAGIKQINADLERSDVPSSPSPALPVAYVPIAPANPVQPDLERFDPIGHKRIDGKHPFSEYKLHITARICGFVRVDGVRVFKDVYSFMASQNGIPTFPLSHKSMEQSGYRITPLADCSAKIDYSDKVQFFVACDRPSQSISSQYTSQQPI